MIDWLLKSKNHHLLTIFVYILNWTFYLYFISSEHIQSKLKQLLPYLPKRKPKDIKMNPLTNEKFKCSACNKDFSNLFSAIYHEAAKCCISWSSYELDLFRLKFPRCVICSKINSDAFALSEYDIIFYCYIYLFPLICYILKAY